MKITKKFSSETFVSFRPLSKNGKIKIQYILTVVLYGCETWSVTLRGKHRFRAYENRALRRMFGRKRDEATRG
jgi:hypothetical protein